VPHQIRWERPPERFEARQAQLGLPGQFEAWPVAAPPAALPAPVHAPAKSKEEPQKRPRRMRRRMPPRQRILASVANSRGELK